MSISQVIGIILMVAAFGYFFWNVWRHYKIAMMAKPDDSRFNNYWERLKGLIVTAFTQIRCTSKKPYWLGAWEHFFLFWGFVFIQFESIGMMIKTVWPSFSWELVWGPSVQGVYVFWEDLVKTWVILMIIVSLIRRFIIREKTLHNTFDAFLILTFIFIIAFTGYLSNGYEIFVEHNEVTAKWAIISLPVLKALGYPYSESAMEVLNGFSLWLHVLVLYVFLNYLLYSKHMHILGLWPKIFFRNLEDNKLKLEPIDFEDESIEKWGITHWEEIPWTRLLDAYACTECNRCTDQCPANTTGKVLAPGDMIQNLRRMVLKEGREAYRKGELPPQEERHGLVLRNEELQEKYGGEVPHEADGTWIIPEEALWQCTTCGACMNVCPVYNEHPIHIMEMRRYFVMTEGSMPQELANTFKNIERGYNPWGIGYNKRADWAKDVDIKHISEVENPEYLYFVGCAGSFDDRAIKVSKAMVNILNAAGISFGFLGIDEVCCGDTARRAGNEYLFDMLAVQNLMNFATYNVKKIIVTCPHGYQTLKHDYPQILEKYRHHPEYKEVLENYEGFEVVHHTQLINELLAQGKIKPKKEFNKKVTYHDSCYLGRHNNIYEEPRAILKNLGGNYIELDRHHDLAFCCGAGGGMMWVEEKGDRINYNRAQEIINKQPEVLAVGCPFCMTMLDDGIKYYGKEEEIERKDIAEIVWEAISD